MKIQKIEWAPRTPIQSPEHETILRELMSYSVLCPTSCLLDTDHATGMVRERHPNSALHWSRAWEWPWAILNSDLRYNHVVLDAAGGHAVFQYAVADRVQRVYNLDTNEASLQAVKEFCEKQDIDGIVTILGDILDGGWGWYPDMGYDRLFCISVIEHIPDYRKAITELVRALRSGGIMVLTLDVVINSAATEQFCIDELAAQKLVESFGGTLPERDMTTMMSFFPSGEILSCLGMVLTKE